MDKTVTAKAKLDKSDVDVQKSIVDKQLDALQRRIATATLKADDTQAQARLKDLSARLDKLRAQAVNIPIKTDPTRATAELRAISLEADRTARDRDLNINVDKNRKATNELSNIGKGIDALQKKGDVFAGGFISDILAIVGLLSGPLAVALSVALVGIAGLVSVVGALGLGFGALGLVIFPVLSGIGKNIKSVTQAQTDLNNATTNADKLKALKAYSDAWAKIPADQKPVIQAVLDLEGALRKISDQVMPNVLSAIRGFLGGIRYILPFISTLANSTAEAIDILSDRFQKAAQRAAQSPYWQQVIRVIGEELPTYIFDLGRIFGNLFAGIVKLVAGFAPAGQSMLDWIIGLTERFNNWATSKGPAELRKLLEYIHTNGPRLGQTLSDVSKALVDTAIALGKLPLSGFVIKVIDDLAKALDEIVKTPVGAWAVGLGLMGGWILKIVGGIFGKTAALADFALGLFGIGDAALFSTGPAYGLGSAIAAMDIALAPLLGLIAAIVLPLAGVGVALFFLATKWKQTTEFFKNGFGQIILYFVPIIGWILLLITHWHGLWGAMQQFADWLRTAGVAVWHFFVDAWHGFVDAIHTLWETVLKPVFDAIVAVIHWVADNWSNIWRIIALVFFGWLAAIVLFLQHNFDAIRDIILGVMNFIWHNIIDPIWHAILAVIDFVMNTIWHGIIEPIFNAIQNFIDGTNHTISNIIFGAWNAIKNIIEGAMNWIWHNVIEPIWNFISNKIGEVVGFIWHNIIDPAWQAISGTTDRVFNDIKNFIVGHLQDALNLGKGIVNGIIHAINWITGGIEKVAQLIGIDIKGDLHIPDLAEAGAKMGAKVDLMAGGGCMDCELGRAMAGGAARIGAGFRTTGPQAIVGEGRAMYPEYVIPTDPIYRQNAMRLVAAMMGDIGMMAAGGTLGPLANAPGRIGSLMGWQGTGVFGLHWSDIPGSGIVKDVWHGAGDLIGDVGRLIRNGIAAGIEEVAHIVGYKWDETPPLWAPVVRGAMIGGTGNKLVDGALNLVRGKENAAKAAGAGMGGAGPPISGTCMDWIIAGLNWPGANKNFGVSCMAARVGNESNCNPRAINLTDSNAIAGHPSVGLTQFIPSTFASRSCPGCTDIWNPICQVCASSKCAPSNCGHGGYGCAAGGMLGDALLPDISALSPGGHRQRYIQALASMMHRPLGQTTGEMMLLGQAKMGAGGLLGAVTSSLPRMERGGLLAKLPRYAAGGSMGARTNNITNNIYNPAGETADDSLTTTLTKLAYRGVLR